MAREYHLPVSDATIPGAPTSSDATRSVVRVVPLAIAVAALLVVAAAATRGFDLSDEGSYWWAAANPSRLDESVTQYHRITGLLYGALGWNVVLVRLARLVLVLAAALLLADAAVRWLTGVGVPLGRDSRLAAFAMVAIAPLAGAIWLPQTFAYNDLVLIGLLLVGASSARAVFARDSRRAVAWAMVAGVAIWAIAMTKFSSAGAVALMSVGMIGLAPEPSVDRRRRVALIGAEAGGFLVAAGLWHLFILGLGETWRGMQVGFEDASSSHDGDFLLELYDFDFQVLRHLALITLAAVLLGRWVRPALGLALWSLGAVNLVMNGPLSTPTDPFGRLTLALHLGPFLLAAALVWRGPTIVRAGVPVTPLRRARLTLFLLLAGVPLLAALGTNNSLLVGSINLAPFWMLAAFVLLVERDRSPVTPVVVFAAVATLLYSFLGIRGTWSEPYRQPPLSRAGATVDGVAALDGVKLEPALAEGLADLDETVSDYAGPGHRWMFALWKLPGLAYVTDSDTPQFVWDRDTLDRNLRAIEEACLDRDPIVIVHRASLTRAYREALSTACGADFPEQWDDLGTADILGEPAQLVGLRGGG